MSESTTYAFTVSMDRLDAFSDALAALVENADCGSAPAEAVSPGATLSRLIRTMATGEHKPQCLTLGFAEDASLRAFQADNPEFRSRHAGKVAVGCFWLRCSPSGDRVMVSLDSATRSISSLMTASASVQAAIRALAPHTMAGEVQLVNEWNEVFVL